MTGDCFAAATHRRQQQLGHHSVGGNLRQTSGGMYLWLEGHQVCLLPAFSMWQLLVVASCRPLEVGLV